MLFLYNHLKSSKNDKKAVKDKITNQAFCEKHKLLLIVVLIRDKLKKSGRLRGISIRKRIINKNK